MVRMRFAPTTYRPARTLSLAAAAAAVLLAAVAPASRAADEPNEPEGRAAEVAAAVRPAAADIDEAIRRGVQALYDRRDKALMWEKVPYDKREMSTDDKKKGQPVGHGVEGGQWGGLTALAAYALLSAGEDPENPDLAEAVRWLTEAPIVGTYALGMRAQVWLNLPPRPEFRQAMLADGNLLGRAIQGNNPEERTVKDDKNHGTFDYLPVETGRVDLSSTQYGVLGVWAYAKYGGEVPLGYWQEMENAWLRWQQPDGGWAYAGEPRADKPTAMSITTAGVASLYVTQDYLHSGEGIGCNGNITNPAIERGLTFLVEGFPYLLGKKDVPDNQAAREKASRNDVHYTLYGVERIGVASGLKYFGDLDWYAEGARWLLDKQSKDGGWGSTENTCFALLFLSTGRQPVFMNKLAYSLDRGDGNREVAAWNQRPRDLANLARYVEAADERELNWQTINFGALDSAAEATRELHDAPVTYLAGSRAVAFNDAEARALKDYVLQGGLLFANADCGGRPFAQSVVDLGEAMFADEGYEFRVLPDSHPIYVDQKFNLADVRRKPKLMGLSNGVRELIVLVKSEDLAREWQLANLQREEAFQVGTNVYLYAVDKQPRGVQGRDAPGDGQLRRRDRPDGEARAGAARGQLGPRARRLAADGRRPAQRAQGRFAGRAGRPGLGGVGGLRRRPPDRHGRVRVAPGPARQAAGVRRERRDAGGRRRRGGDAAFATAADAALRAAFGEKAGELSDVLPAAHPLYRAAGEPVEAVDYRLAALETLGAARTPRLRGIAFGNRLGVVQSNEDLSNGLVGAPVAGVVGYTPQDATRLMEAILLYAAEE